MSSDKEIVEWTYKIARKEGVQSAYRLAKAWESSVKKLPESGNKAEAIRIWQMRRKAVETLAIVQGITLNKK